MIQIKMKIDTSKIDLEGLGNKIADAAEKGLRQLTQQAYEEWQNIAARRLKSTRRVYQDALSFEVDGSGVGHITLQAKDPSTNWLVTKLETGVASFDMKPSRLAGKPARHWSDLHPTKPGEKKKNPPFVDIPFRTKSKQQAKPDRYRRISEKSTGFIHPGFKPIGKAGPGPMREEVVEYVRKTAPDVFQPLLARVLV